MMLVMFTLLGVACTPLPPPRFSIGHCTGVQVEAQRAAFLADVVPAVTYCAQHGAPEDCPEADAATERWLAARAGCREGN